MERLSVWLQGLRAGALDYDDRTNSFTFSYDPDYLARGDAAALSVSLPLREAAYDPYVSRKFFENLLPPEVVRRKLELVLHISVGNVFGCRSGWRNAFLTKDIRLRSMPASSRCSLLNATQ